MKKYKFLIIGSKGLLGSNIVKYLRKNKISHKKIARNNSDYNLDLKNFEKLKYFFSKNKFEIVINCVAKVNIDFCEKNYKEAKLINLNLVKYLSLLSKLYGFKLVQISTDQVYNQKKHKLNKEEDRVAGANKYAILKIKSENSLKNQKNYLIIRTNFTGKRKNSFIDWLIKSIKKERTINLFSDMYTSTLDVSTCAKYIVKLSLLNANGVYNLGTKNMISKKQFAIYVSKLVKKKIYYKTTSCDILSTRRSKNLGLNIKKIEKKVGEKMITSQEAIKNLVSEYR
jgi:dTDP-4-dehydrorhamnose reductase